MKKIYAILILFGCFGSLIGQTNGDYKSINSGSWFDAANWSYYFNGWNDNYDYPLNILTTRTVSVDHELTLPGLFQINGGTLVINSGGKITISPTGIVEVNSGTFTNSVGVSGLIIQSNSVGTGSIDYDGSPLGTLETFVSTSQWHLFGPVASVAAGTLFNTGYMQSWTDGNPTGSWTAETGNPTLARGYGDAFYFYSNFTAEYSGSLNGSAVTISGLGNATGETGDDQDGYHLLANPFPCAIDLDLCSRSDMAGIGDCQIYSGTGYGAASGNVIGAGQGFFIQLSPSASGVSFTFPTGAKVQDHKPLYKSTASFDDIDFMEFRLNDVLNISNAQLLVRFREEATFEYDSRFDGHNILGDATAADIVARIAENETVSVLGIPVPQESYSVDLDFIKGEADEYILNLPNIDISSLGTSVTFKDNLNGYTEVITSNDFSYSFEALEDQSARFTLVFASTTGIGEELASETIRIWNYNNKLYLDQEFPAKGDLCIYDISGRLIFNTQIESSEQNIVDFNEPSGSYIVKFVSEGKSFSQKIIK